MGKIKMVGVFLTGNSAACSASKTSPEAVSYTHLDVYKRQPFSIAILSVSTICMMLATSSYLRIVHRWDPLSALLGASPGSMAQVIALAAEFGADLRGIAIVQTMRVLVVTIGLPGGLALFGLAAGGVIVDVSYTHLPPQ